MIFESSHIHTEKIIVHMTDKDFASLYNFVLEILKQNKKK